MAQPQTDTAWTTQHIESLAPDATSVPAARKVLTKGGFGVVEPTADGRGWWVPCRGLTGSYQVTVRRAGDAFDCRCNCRSYKDPCKHALALLLHLVEHPELRAAPEPSKATAGDFESLVRAVFANPDDDTPRLVFADFLDENDQHDRATLIRYQCEQARLRANSNRYKELTRAINKLVPKVRKQTGVFPYAHRHTGMQYTFVRGFLHLQGSFERLDLDAAPARFVNLFRDGWVESVRASLSLSGVGDPAAGWELLLAHVAELDASASVLSDDNLHELVATTNEARVTGRLVRIKVHKRNQTALDRLIRVDRGEVLTDAPALEDNRSWYMLTPPLFNLLSRSGRLSGAQSLRIEGEFGDAEVAALLAADRSRLDTLELQNWRLSKVGTEALMRGLSRPGGALRELNFYRCYLKGVAQALVTAGPWGQLEKLDLQCDEWTDADAAVLAVGAELPKLTHIKISGGARLTAAGMSVLLSSSRLTNLEELVAPGTPHPIPLWELIPPLIEAPARQTLEVRVTGASATRTMREGEVALDVFCEMWWKGESFARLAECAELKRVTEFAGRFYGVHAAALTAVAAAFDPTKLRVLNLRNNRFGNRGAAALASAFGAFSLRELNLSYCKLTTAGVTALAKSPLMAALEKLDLSQNALGKGGVQALLKMNALALRELDLADCAIAAPEQRQLKKHFASKVKL